MTYHGSPLIHHLIHHFLKELLFTYNIMLREIFQSYFFNSMPKPNVLFDAISTIVSHALYNNLVSWSGDCNSIVNYFVGKAIVRSNSLVC